MRPIIHASLFSGIGGAEIAASWMGWQNAFHCEIADFPRRVLEYWFPKSESYADITQTDFTKWHGRIDVLTGGFPCQPFSLAGKRQGADDDRYLWPEMLRAIREIQPTWVVGENVSGLVTMVQPSEAVDMGCDGSIFEENHIFRRVQQFTIGEICGDFERAGYSVQPFVIPACAVGAPHQRNRVWIVAHRNDAGAENERERKDGVLSDRAAADTQCQRPIQPQQRKRSRHEERVSSGTYGAAADTDSDRQRQWTDEQEPKPKRKGTSDTGIGCEDGTSDNTGCCGRHEGEFHDGCSESAQKEECGKEQPCGTDSPLGWWRNFPTQSPVCGRDDGLPFDVDDLTVSFREWREESIKAYGNAWVPQVAYEIFRAIQQIEQYSH